MECWRTKCEISEVRTSRQLRRGANAFVWRAEDEFAFADSSVK